MGQILAKIDDSNGGVEPGKVSAGSMPPQSSRRQPGPLLIAVLVAACAVALAVSLDAALLNWIVMRAVVVTITAAPGVVLALACLGLGVWCIPRRFLGIFTALPGASDLRLTLPEFLVAALGCGMGIMSSLVFLAGMAGALSTVMALVLANLGVWSLLIWARRSLLEVKASRAATPVDPSLIKPVRASSAMRILLVLLAGCLVLMAAISLTPPLIFDVTEYHLGAWTSYQREGAGAMFVPMPHNFYARFPFPLEALYFLGLALAPFVDSAPKVFNAICVAACALLMISMGRRLGAGRTAAVLAGLLTLTHPVMMDVSIDAMIDAPAALLVSSSFLLAFVSLGAFAPGRKILPGSGNPGNPGAGLLLPTFLLFGTALASKYTVAQLYLLPWALLVFAPLVWRFGRHRAGLLLLALAVGAVPCLLWLGKNVAWYGNPLEPFFQRWFRPDLPAEAAREKFYVESHFPQSPLTAGYWATLLPRLREFQWVMLAACAGWMFREKRRGAALLVIATVLAYLLWNTVRDSQNRFLLPMLMFVSALAAAGADAMPARWARRTVMTILVMFSLAQMTRYTLMLHEGGVVSYLADFSPSNPATAAPEGPNWAQADDKVSPREAYLERNLGDLGRMVNHTNRTLPSDASLLLVYEARPYLFRPATTYNVVWDDSTFLNIIRPATTSQEAWQMLRRADVTHVLVNRQELLRYIQQYARPRMLLPLGVRAGDDPRSAWVATAHPEDLYPPFFRDPDWERLRPVVHNLLDEIDRRATARHGSAVPGPPSTKPLDITLTPILGLIN